MANNHFQGEIGVFFPLIVLRSLDGSECPLSQKLSVLRYDVHLPHDLDILCSHLSILKLLNAIRPDKLWPGP